jgi:hypothetical protein
MRLNIFNRKKCKHKWKETISHIETSFNGVVDAHTMRNFFCENCGVMKTVSERNDYALAEMERDNYLATSECNNDS